MFDFERLEIYQKAKSFNLDVYRDLKSIPNIDIITRSQLRRASLSVMLNIAEGCSRFSKKDRRHFYVIARGSLFECVAIFDFVKAIGLTGEDLYKHYYIKAEELSKMIFSMIRSLE
jgi:four helix bundle protein